MDSYILFNKLIDYFSSINRRERLIYIKEKINELKCTDYGIEYLKMYIDIEIHFEFEFTPLLNLTIMI